MSLNKLGILVMYCTVNKSANLFNQDMLTNRRKYGIYKKDIEESRSPSLIG